VNIPILWDIVQNKLTALEQNCVNLMQDLGG